MSTTVSKSPKPEDEVPSRAERDESYSTGAGKKAVEVPKVTKEDSKDNNKADSAKLEPPIGLDNETRSE